MQIPYFCKRKSDVEINAKVILEGEYLYRIAENEITETLAARSA